MATPVPSPDRRQFLRRGAACIAAGALASAAPLTAAAAPAPEKSKAPFKISLAQWSLHRTLRQGKISNVDFAATANELGIDAIEYVNQFFKDKAKDKKYLFQLKDRARQEGVQTLLIMIDGEGRLGDPDAARRTKAVENHYRWVEAAQYLGCHSIRVNAASSGEYDDQIKLAADGLRRVTEFAEPYGINVIVENHGGLSSNGAWLASVMKTVGLPTCGTLPDFGNFHVGGGKWYDRYKGVTELMPYAKAVSAKSHVFDEAGNEKNTDFRRMMKIVCDAGYHGYVGIEWEGGKPGEIEGIRLTKQLLARVGDEMSS